MKYLEITNAGEIEAEALTLLGASSKDGDNSKIGMFGSGNKYALAWLLRNDAGLQIFSGEDQIQIGTVNKTFREQEFDVITINGNETSITTRTGIDWSAWEAIREIYSNAIDEGDTLMDEVDEITPEAGKTKFYVEMKGGIAEFFLNFDDYFAKFKKVMHETKTGKFLQKHGVDCMIYRKGIRVNKSGMKSVFDYDFNDIEITESRTVKNHFEAQDLTWRMIFECDDEFLIKKIFSKLKDKDYVESHVYEWRLQASRMSDVFKNYVESITIWPLEFAGHLEDKEKLVTTFLPGNLHNFFKDSLKIQTPPSMSSTDVNAKYAKLKPSKLHEDTIKKANFFFEECQFDQQYEVVVASFFDKDIFGTINRENQQIILSDIAIEEGTQKTIVVMLEEYCHLKYQCEDETRKMQHSLIEMMVNQMKVQAAYNV